MAIEIHRNNLDKEGSPYLLQHRDNPVHWQPWSDEIFKIAEREKKLVIISIGYSACHWCHVMEHESFSDPEVAELMNGHFISVKVDREERPDVDRVYMNAALLMNGQGGWPLNAVALPDGRPVFAGTYFPKRGWMNLLNRLLQIRKEQPDMLEESAGSVTSAILDLEESPAAGGAGDEFSAEQYRSAGGSFLGMMDPVHGGFMGAPKFPLPSGLGFLLDFYHYTGEEKAMKSLSLALEKMAGGGIYDHLGGGFARYSTDAEWKVPHFEKMLYDNAQLLGLYSDVYRVTGNEPFRETATGIYRFLMREMCSGKSGDEELFFYSGLDADSEGEEGKFYTWSAGEMDEVLGPESEEIKKIFNVKVTGNWELGRNILYRSSEDITVFSDHQKNLLEKLLSRRESRIRPALDHKMVTAWNGLTVIGLVDAWTSFGEPDFLETALACGHFLKHKMIRKDGGIFRIYDPEKEKAGINGFLDDIAFTASAFLKLYRATLDESWVYLADRLIRHGIEEYFSQKKNLFFFTSARDSALIVRSMEIQDNVIPSSNAVMAHNLCQLGSILQVEEYTEISRGMLKAVSNNIEKGGFSYSHWLRLAGILVYGPVEVAVTGPEHKALSQELNRKYLPHMVLMGGGADSMIPSVLKRAADGETRIHVCRDKICLAPVKTVEAALKFL